MVSVVKDLRDLFHAAQSVYAKTPTRLKEDIQKRYILSHSEPPCMILKPLIVDLYVVYGLITALIQVVYVASVGTFPFNAFLSGVLSCIGTSVLGICLRMQVNPVNKEFKDLPPERAFADFVLINLVLHLVIMNFLG